MTALTLCIGDSRRPPRPPGLPPHAHNRLSGAGTKAGRPAAEERGDEKTHGAAEDETPPDLVTGGGIENVVVDGLAAVGIGHERSAAGSVVGAAGASRSGMTGLVGVWKAEYDDHDGQKKRDEQEATDLRTSERGVHARGACVSPTRSMLKSRDGGDLYVFGQRVFAGEDGVVMVMSSTSDLVGVHLGHGRPIIDLSNRSDED